MNPYWGGGALGLNLKIRRLTARAWNDLARGTHARQVDSAAGSSHVSPEKTDLPAEDRQGLPGRHLQDALHRVHGTGIRIQETERHGGTLWKGLDQRRLERKRTSARPQSADSPPCSREKNL